MNTPKKLTLNIITSGPRHCSNDCQFFEEGPRLLEGSSARCKLFVYYPDNKLERNPKQKHNPYKRVGACIKYEDHA